MSRNRKLSDSQVAQIRGVRSSLGRALPLKQIAAAHSVTISCISQICRGLRRNKNPASGNSQDRVCGYPQASPHH